MPTARVVLLRPPVEVLHKFSKPVENLAIGYLAAALRRAGHEAFMLDGMLFDWSEQETARRALAENPDIVACTTVLQYFPKRLRNLFLALREGGFDGPILIGGHSASFMATPILENVPEIDAVVSGEGEHSIVAIADAHMQRADWRGVPGVSSRSDAGIRSVPPQRIRDLDSVANPARDLTPEVIQRDGLVAVSTSRGCYARCSFCSVPRFYGLERGAGLAAGNWLARSAAGAAAEIAELHEHFGVLEVLIVDDEFFGGSTAGKLRARRFAGELIQRQLPTRFTISCRAENVDVTVMSELKEAGLAHVFVGLEAGGQSDLRLYGKGHTVKQNLDAVHIIKSLGLSFQPGFMLFNYRSSLDDLRRGLTFLRDIGELKPVTVNSAMDPHFGAPITTDVRRKGLLIDDGLAMKGRFADPRVALLKKVASRCAAAFIPFMNTLAAVRSAITWEWRRTVPWRSAAEEALLDELEVQVNQGLCAPVLWALDELEAHPTSAELPTEELLDRVGRTLEAETERLRLKQAMVLLHLEQREGQVRYVTQSELIGAQAGGAPAHA